MFTAPSCRADLSGEVFTKNRVTTSMPIANIMDNVPFVNILPFGMCSSIANPVVASATAAALIVFVTKK